MQILPTRQCIGSVIKSGSFPVCYSYCFTQRLPDKGQALWLSRGDAGSATLLGDALQPVDHGEHHGHGEDAEAGEYGPAFPLIWEGVEHRDAKGDEQVADGRGRQPQTLADALQMLGRDLRYERQSERRNEQLGHREEEVCKNQYGGAGFHRLLDGLGKSLEFLARRIVVDYGHYHQEYIRHGGDGHTEGNLFGG